MLFDCGVGFFHKHVGFAGCGCGACLSESVVQRIFLRLML